MRELFGNPTDGSFLAWLADYGVWTALVVVGALLFWYVVHRITEAWIQRTVTRMEDHWLLSDFVKGQFFQRWIDELAIAVLVIPPTVLGVLDLLGVDIGPVLKALRDAWSDGVWPWMTDHGLKIVVILIVGWLASNILGKAMPKLLTRAVLGAANQEETPEEAKRRADTLSGVFSGIVTVVIFLLILLTILQELSIAIGPLIGSLGLVGVAVGFGAQWLVRDVIAGAFIIAENQYRKGDAVQVAGVSGLVEDINLRRTLLRDIDGKVHVVSNGEIKIASNFSRKWARVNIDIDVAYKHDIDHVMNILTEIGEKMAREPYWSEVLLETPKPLGVDKLNASSLSFKILAMTKPLKNPEVKRELLHRIKRRFDEEGIEMPFSTQTVYWGDGAHPSKGDQGSTEAARELKEKLQASAAAVAMRRSELKDQMTSEAVAAAEKNLALAFERLAEQRARAAGTGPAPVSAAPQAPAQPGTQPGQQLTESERRDAIKTRGMDDADN